MNFEDCVSFANTYPMAFMATSENSQPHVRPLALQYADTSGFYFQTEPVKRLYNQLQKNSKVEVCFYNPEDTGLGKVMRVVGEAEFVEDKIIKTKILESQPFLQTIGIDDIDNPLLVVFRIKSGEAFFWTVENNMKEYDIEVISFGV